MTIIEAPSEVSLCEIVGVMQAAHLSVYGHWAGDERCHYGCAHPVPPESIASRVPGDPDRLVVLLTKFAYCVHTPDEQTEMLALIKGAHP